MSCNLFSVTDSQGPGRPRSEQARAAVLAAALHLVARDGYPAVTVKGIAAEAGVGRQTVYRWWPTKADVVLEAVVDLAARAASPEASDDAVDDIHRALRANFALRIGQPAISGLMAEATHDREFAVRLQEQLLAPRRRFLRDLLTSGQARGQLGTGTDVDLVVDVVFGVMWYRVLSGHAPVDMALADQLADTVGTLLGPPSG